jgi:hypothetical protein
MNYTTFCGGINGDCAAGIKKSLDVFVEQIYKKRSLESSGSPVLYIVCMVPKG